MAYTLGHVQYGKAEVRVVRVYRDSDPHEIVDHNVSVSLTGEVQGAWLEGDNAACLTTDAMKNTVNAYALEHAEQARQPESFALALATHFVRDLPQVSGARVSVETYPWVRLDVPDGDAHPHAFRRDGGFVRTATVRVREEGATVVSGIRDLTVLKTTDSEYQGFFQDAYTTLAPTTDRILATSVTGQWLHAQAGGEHDWAAEHAGAVAALTGTFAGHYSRALQHTLHAMGGALLDAVPGVEEVRLSMPNKHHFLLDLSPFGLDNRGEVFHADDRPYGLIEGTVRRSSRATGSAAAFDPGMAW